MFPRSALLVCLLPLALQTACEPKKKASSELATVSATSLEGVWAKHMVFASETSLLNNKAKAKVGRYNLVRISLQDGVVQVSEKACGVDTAASGPLTLSFLPSFIPSLPVRSYSYLIEGSSAGLRLRVQNLVEVVGARLQAPLTEPLPSSSSDPRVFDQDLDGQPGLTVELSVTTFVKIAALIYQTQRTSWSEDLALVDGETLRGSLNWQQDQVTLGANLPLVAEAKAQVTILPNESGVLMRKLGGDASCADVMQQKDSLFPRLTP